MNTKFNAVDKYGVIICYINPLRFENMSKKSEVHNENISKSVDIQCTYVTSEQLTQITSKWASWSKPYSI